ncbi:MAG: AraC family transcriptional regulator [Lachnospiraceae bacterium]|nr:AraC family transcriptional regulator [Lachnospiraceae bacterium]
MDKDKKNIENEKNTEIALNNLIFKNRENATHHYSYEIELNFFSKVCAGDVEAVKAAGLPSKEEINSTLSDKPILQERYLFAINAALLTRHCINAGMDSMDAFAYSDFFIKRMDECQTIEEIQSLNLDMMIYYTKQMRITNKMENKPSYTKPILLCMDFVYNHLHEKISLNELADFVALSPNYLATLFKKETGETIQNYIADKKIDSAKRMLNYSDYSLTEIGNYLAFSSTSHFIKVFKEKTGMTPGDYKKTSARQSLF